MHEEIWQVITNGTVHAACLHRELRPRTTNDRLCYICASKVRVRHFYKQFRRLNPGWDEHLQRLVQRAKQKLPLFPANPKTRRFTRAEKYPCPNLATCLLEIQARPFDKTTFKNPFANPSREVRTEAR